MQAGLVIRQTREGLNLTQQQLAELADVDHSTVSRIERGLIDSPARTLKALVDALGGVIAAREHSTDGPDRSDWTSYADGGVRIVTPKAKS